MERIGREDTQDYLISGNRYANTGDFTDTINLGKRVRITENDVFLYPEDEDIKEHMDDLLQMINYHTECLVPVYKLKRDYYKGRHRKIIMQDGKKLGKPDNRIIVNFPKKLVNTFNGFFSGNPVTIQYQEGETPDVEINKKIQEFLKSNDYEDTFSEVSKYADIYGRAFLYTYSTDDPNTNEVKLNFAATTPIDTFVVYDDTVQHKPLFAVRCTSNETDIVGTLITDTADYVFKTSTNGDLEFTNTNEDLDVIKETDMHPYPGLPVIEFEENNERIGLFDDVVNLIDSIDKAMSEKANDVDFFSDAYLAISGVKLTKEQVENITNSHLINLYNGEENSAYDEKSVVPTADFLSKDSDDNTQEHYLDRAVNLLYQISQVVDLNDTQFGSAADASSGVALINKYQPMQTMANTKSRKFNKVLRQLFKIMFDVSGIKGDVENLTFKYTQDIPHDMEEESNVVQKLAGHVSDETLLSTLSFIDDPKKELDRISQEQKNNQNATLEIFNQQTDQEKAGEVNDNDSTGKEKDPATN